MRLFACHALITLAALALCANRTLAQQPTSGTLPGESKREQRSPGANTPYESQSEGSIIGAKPGSLRPRMPIRTRPRTQEQFTPEPSAAAPEAATGPLDVPNAWSILLEIHDAGPPNGLTLDQAIEQLMQASVALRAKALDIGQAQADVLTAGMRANPVAYVDKQLIPYKQYNSVTNPGGPAQYDLNFAYPADLTRKRGARMAVAEAAKRVVDAVYQDAVRLEIDRVCNAYVDALAARLAVRTTRDGLVRIDEIRKRSAGQKQQPGNETALLHQIQIQRQTVSLALIDAEAAYRNSKRTLATALDLPREQIPLFELRGTLEDTGPPPPRVEQLVSMALTGRPDVVAYRLGLERAGADVRLAQANRLPDAYLLYQPFTYQDNSPFNAPSSRSWAAGLTVTLPLFDRNQGNIRRAQLNRDQTQLELRALEQRVTSEVEAAYDDYVATKRGITEIQQEVLPYIEQALGESLQHFRQGTLDAAGYLTAQRDLDDLGRQYRDLLVRHRRSMISVNTAVGSRVLP